MSRIFAIVIDPKKGEKDRFEILNSNFIPEIDTVLIIKQDGNILKAIVVKVESVLDRIGDSADLMFNIFIKHLEDDMN